MTTESIINQIKLQSPPKDSQKSMREFVRNTASVCVTNGRYYLAKHGGTAMQ